MRSSFSKVTQPSWRTEAICAVVLGTVFGGVSYNYNYERENRIPLAFSEFGKTAKLFKEQGRPVPPLTRIYAKSNDVPMKVFESRNIAFETSRGLSNFAGELETRVNPALKVYYQISDYAHEVPGDARDALQSLNNIIKATNDLPPVINTLARTWDESHRDVTHTETSCDSEGKNCTSREVYDYTIHSYTYYPQQAAASVQLLGAFLKNHPDLTLKEQLQLAAKTDVENEYAIEKSMKILLKGAIPSPEQALAFANTWATGSNLTKYHPEILSSQAQLTGLAPAFDSARRTARSQTYRTYSSSDSGPKEFQVAQTTLAHAKNIYNSSHKITDGIEYAGNNIPVLNSKIKELIAVMLDGEKGNAKRLQGEVMQISRAIYQKNFENGFDVQPFKWGEVVFLACLGTIFGGLAGAGAKRYAETRRTGQKFFR